MKENLQTMVWAIGSVIFITSMAIAWIVWRVSTKASKDKKTK